MTPSSGLAMRGKLLELARKAQTIEDHGILSLAADMATSSVWRPISTAPHNQRVIVQVHSESISEIAIGWWDEIDGQWYYSPQGGFIKWNPTDWMPVPAPPASKDRPES